MVACGPGVMGWGLFSLGEPHHSRWGVPSLAVLRKSGEEKRGVVQGELSPFLNAHQKDVQGQTNLAAAHQPNQPVEQRAP